MKPKATNLTRRQMLKAAGAGALAMPFLIPARALGKDGFVAPSERILLGGIGLGGRGTAVLNWMLAETDVQFVAICDARKLRRERGRATTLANADALCRPRRSVLSFGHIPHLSPKAARRSVCS